MERIDLQSLKINLNKRGFLSKVFESKESLIKEVESLIYDKTVGFGSSLTLNSLGIIEAINTHAEKVFYHYPGEHGENERAALTADIFFTSANAITCKGEIINIDGTGNRVAATCFGPKKIIYIISENKVTEDLESALDRAKESAVKLTKHFKRKTPCVTTGKCEDCLSPESVCSITTIHRKKPYGSDIHVFLIDGEYGL